MGDACMDQSTNELEVCTTLEYILLGDLRDVLQELPNDVMRRWLLALLEALLETLSQRFHLEEEDGYLLDVLDSFPNWSQKVGHLRNDHTVLCETLKEIHGRIAETEDYREISAEAGRDLSRWISALEKHHQQEDGLILSAVNLELGGAD
jgi:hypothetical protein